MFEWATLSPLKYLLNVLYRASGTGQRLLAPWMEFYFGLNVCTLHVNTFAFKKFSWDLTCSHFLHRICISENWTKLYSFACVSPKSSGRSQMPPRNICWTKPKQMPNKLVTRLSCTHLTNTLNIAAMSDDWSRVDVLRPVGAIWIFFDASFPNMNSSETDLSMMDE